MNEDATVCMMNIGPRERRKRLSFGVVALVVGLGALGGLWLAGAAPGWRLLLFLPFFAAASGYFQARDKT